MLDEYFNPVLSDPDDPDSAEVEVADNNFVFHYMAQASVREALNLPATIDEGMPVDARLDPQLIERDHLEGKPFYLDSAIYSMLSCPSLNEMHDYGGIRPIVCEDGLARAAKLGSGHDRQCNDPIGTQGCELRIVAEPNYTLGGGGYGAGGVMDADDSYWTADGLGNITADDGLDMFYDEDGNYIGYRHVCQYDANGVPVAVTGRAGADGRSYIWNASSKRWVLGTRAPGDHHLDHPPEDGHYTAAQFYLAKVASNVPDRGATSNASTSMPMRRSAPSGCSRAVTR